MNDKKYYEILGITDEERKLQGEEFKKVLNKKYKKLAVQYHPDKYATKSEEERKAAEEKFKEISEANTVLSDENARAQYDNGGIGGMDIDEFMRHFSGFGMGNPFGDMFGSRQQENPIAVSVRLTFEESVNGCIKEFETDMEKCPNCHGSGMITQSMNQGNGMFMMRQSYCPHCGGSGYIHSGTKYTEKVQIPAGIANGMRFKSNANGQTYIITCIIEEDPYFTRVDQTNVVHEEYVPFNECLLGFTKDFKTISGGKVTVVAPECTPDGKAFIFHGEGFKRVGPYDQKGDYAVVIKYKYPNKLTNEQKEALKVFNKD